MASVNIISNVGQKCHSCTALRPNKKSAGTFSQESAWKLYNGDFLDSFVKSDKELSNLLSDFMKLLEEFKLKLNLKELFKFENDNPIIQKFLSLLKSKYSIDVKEPPRMYRFVSKAEIEELKSKGKISPSRYLDVIDVTINPDLNWNEYRITFKPIKKFSILDPESKIIENRAHTKDYYYYLKDSYTIDDVESIEKIM